MRTVPCSSVTSCGSVEHGRALRAGVRDAAVDVGHLERDVDDAVAVPAVVVGTGLRRVDRRRCSTNRTAPERST